LNRLTALLVSSLALAASTNANSIQLIVNGGFETGNFTGWNAQTEAGGDGPFLVSSGTTAPLSGRSTAGPSSGTFYAIADQNDTVAASVLTQGFTVAAGASSVVVSFDLFVNNFSSGGVVTGPIDFKKDTQFGTVDLLTGTANAFSTAPADVLRNFYQGADDPSIISNPYTTYTFDITSLVSAGGRYQIRFGDVASQDFIAMGVDNVSVTETVAPEPATFLLIVPALGALAAWKRRPYPDCAR
jgi:hypothetical protein